MIKGALALSAAGSVLASSSVKLVVEWNTNTLIESTKMTQAANSIVADVADVADFYNALPSRQGDSIEQSVTKLAAGETMVSAVQKYLGGRVVHKITSEQHPALSTGITAAATSVKDIKRLNVLGMDIIEVESIEAAKELLAALQAHPDVKAAALDAVVDMVSPIDDSEEDGFDVLAEASELSAGAYRPNDKYYGKQWHFKNLGLEDFYDDATFLPATATKTVLVGVVDSGVDDSHPDLVDSLWTNVGEIPGNGIDDDNNGYVDDYYGINSSGNTRTPDLHESISHGSHVNGLIGATGNNKIGVAGVGHGVVKLINAKFLVNNQKGNVYSAAIEGINYVAANGGEVANHSYGGGMPEDARVLFKAALTNSHMANFIAAGNESRGVHSALFPIAFSATLDNVVGIGASTKDNKHAYFSNYGPDYVNTYAPGHKVFSTLKRNFLKKGGYKNMSGTSMASPVAAGVGALLIGYSKELLAQAGASQDLKLTPAELKDILSKPELSTPSKTITNKAQSEGIINVPLLVKAVKTITDAKIAAGSASPATPTIPTEDACSSYVSTFERGTAKHVAHVQAKAHPELPAFTAALKNYEHCLKTDGKLTKTHFAICNEVLYTECLKADSWPVAASAVERM